MYEDIDFHNMSTAQIKEHVLKDQGASYWLQLNILKLDERDVVDALHDVEFLKSFLENKMHNMGGGL